MSSDPVIHVSNLVVEYGGRKNGIRAVDGVSFDVQPGECVGFIGPNGAGKSSTIKTLMGFVYPAEGEVSVFGETAGTVAAKRRIGYLPEVTLYYPFLTGSEMLRLYGTLHGVARADLVIHPGRGVFVRQRIVHFAHQLAVLVETELAGS